MTGADTRARRHPLRRYLAVGLIVAVAAYGHTVGSPAPAAAAVPAPTAVDPATTNFSAAAPCVGFCLGPSYNILQSTIPVEPADSAGVFSLQARADELFRELHDLKPDDPRVRESSQAEVAGTMYMLLLSIINTPAAERTAEAQGVYHWFQQVVRNYRLASARAAKQEYQNWLGLQCGYDPGEPPPAPQYEPGLGCTDIQADPNEALVATVSAGARLPAFADLQTWGGLKAHRTLGATDTTVRDMYRGIAAGLVATGGLAGVGFTYKFLNARMENVLTKYSSLLQNAQRDVKLAKIGELAEQEKPRMTRALKTLGTRMISFGLGVLLFPIAAILTIVAAVVVVILAAINFANAAALPVDLDKAIANADQLPNLEAMLNDPSGDGADLIFSLFAAQTDIQSMKSLFRFPDPPKPNWSGDVFESQSVDRSSGTDVFVGERVSSKGLRVQSWGQPGEAITMNPPTDGTPPTLTFVTDDGYFWQSVDDGQSWEMESLLRYFDWDGKKRMAVLSHDGNFMDIPAEDDFDITVCGQEVQDVCRLEPTLRMLDANGTPIGVTLIPLFPVPSVIEDDSNGVYRVGETTTFTNPEVDNRGNQAEYDWTFETRCDDMGGCRPFLDPNTLNAYPDPLRPLDPFHGKPIVKKSGQTVTHTWPASGTFLMKLVTHNPAGFDVAFKTITVEPADGPTAITLGRSVLGELASTGAASFNACFTRSSPLNKPRVEIDWGDGTVQSGRAGIFDVGPSSTLDGVFIQVDMRFGLQQPGTGNSSGTEPTATEASAEADSLAIDFDPDKDTIGCSGDFSVSPSHVYARNDDGYFPVLRVEDEDGQVATKPLGHVTVAPELPVLTMEKLTWTNTPTHVMRVIDAGGTAQLNLVFNADPGLYADIGVSINWGDGQHTAFVKQCNTAGECTIPGVQEIHISDTRVLWALSAQHEYRSGPGIDGMAVYTARAQVENGTGGVAEESIEIGVRGVAPTISGLTVTPTALAQGGTVTVTGTVSLDDTQSPVIVDVVWPSPSGPINEAIQLAAGPGPKTFSATLAMRGRGPQTIRVVARDWSGATNQESVGIDVTNVAPAPSVEPISGDEGAPVAFTVVTGDPGWDSYSLNVDWGDGTPPTTTPATTPAVNVLTTPAHTYAVPGEYDVAVTIDDGSGPRTVTTAATILNVDPKIALDALAPDIGSTATRLFVFANDPGGIDGMTGVVDWRDGSPPESFDFPNGSPTQVDHTYAYGGVYPIKVTVSDQHGGTSDEATHEVTVQGKPGFKANQPPVGIVGEDMGYQFAAVGFPVPEYHTVLGEGDLPPGLTLGADGFLSGKPTATGDFTFKVMTFNTYGHQIAGPITMSVVSKPAFTAATPPNAVLDRFYFYSFAATEGDPPGPVTYGVVSGALPAGLSLNTTTGVLLGTPTALGTSTFRIGATNATGTTTTPDLTIGVFAPPFLTLADGLTRMNFRASFTANASRDSTAAMELIVEPDAGGTATSTPMFGFLDNIFFVGLAPELADGSYIAVARQTDADGSSIDSDPVAFSIDTTAPEVTLTSPTGTVTTATPTFTGTGPPSSQFAEFDSDNITIAINRVAADGTESLARTVVTALDSSDRFSTTVTDPGLADGNYTATATRSDGLQVGTSNRIAFTVDTPPSADLAIAMTATPLKGAITYDVSLSNLGTDAATSVVVTDVLPSGTVFQSAVVPAGWTCSLSKKGKATTVTCTTASFAANTSIGKQLTFKVTAPGGKKAKPITNTITVSSGTHDPDTTNNTASATAKPL